jgi:hypothetical protein
MIHEIPLPSGHSRPLGCLICYEWLFITRDSVIGKE